ncbi:RdgB/HAM1 family non-canonical purine NTP pyrophosphatase [Gracilinema caldarium]|uniref:dITP/XTP pyrophosphatase n=1 Tax=Gracilinema caldarium (strain ATCC 51460 / DSM 7334 / H1) TaxID=744872 RepID=F8F1R6_GRAC1|nr:RdgB/HAM1 family non-canonical purine NTP pyrophosphatase [Gracilinema caldarium]AEJ19400.1 Nucleoside-triphosphatase rdgB [Gracilinema caldarium DSM 7334]
MKLWLATNNEHKKRELEQIFSGHILVTPASAGLVFDPDETGSTFIENTLIKARVLYDLVHEPVIADDSGLCVDALDGRPGVFSARYGSTNGKKLESWERNALLLKELEHETNRKARFVCSMVALFSHDRFYVVQETLEGEIIRESRGSGGFGYDPILYLPERGCTVAELSEDEKNRISHRGKAGKALAKLLTWYE